MKKAAKWVVAAVILAGIVMQFFRPELTNPPIEPGSDFMASNPPPAEIAALLHGACYDCHSYETKWPWYSHVSPVNWLLASHVNDGRDAMNFSEWPHDNAANARKRLNRISHRLEDGSMPIANYTWIHSAARLSPEQRKKLEDSATNTAAKIQ